MVLNLFEDEVFDAISTTFGPAEMLALMKWIMHKHQLQSCCQEHEQGCFHDAVDRGHNGRDANSEVNDGFKADDKLYFENGVKLNISVAFVDRDGQRDLFPLLTSPTNLAQCWQKRC